LDFAARSGIPQPLARDEQERIRDELAHAQKVLATSEVVYRHIEDVLNRALAHMGRIDEVYALGGSRVRRSLPALLRQAAHLG
jgi:hypothetical protein